MNATPGDGANAILTRYGLRPPSAEEAQAALARVVGDERARALWKRACHAAGLEADGARSLRQLKRVAACMATLPGPEGVMGASLTLRLAAYEALAASVTADAGGGRAGPVSSVEMSGGDPVLREDRLQEIADLEMMAPGEDPRLQKIASQAAESLHMPIGIVTVVLDHAQYYAAAHGLQGWAADVRGTPVEWSFCAHAVRSREPYVIENALDDPLVGRNPLVQQEGIRSYAGIPLITSRGHVLGTLCVAGVEEHSFPPEDLDKLRGLARDAVEHIETRRR